MIPARRYIRRLGHHSMVPLGSRAHDECKRVMRQVQSVVRSRSRLVIHCLGARRAVWPSVTRRMCADLLGEPIRRKTITLLRPMRAASRRANVSGRSGSQPDALRSGRGPPLRQAKRKEWSQAKADWRRLEKQPPATTPRAPFPRWRRRRCPAARG